MLWKAGAELWSVAASPGAVSVGGCVVFHPCDGPGE